MKRHALVILCAVCVFVIGAGRVDRADRIDWSATLLIQMQVSDLDRAVAFYSETLGMEVESVNRDLRWARIKPGIADVTIGLGVGEPGSAPIGSGSVSLNLGVNNLDETRALLEAKGVEFLGPTLEIPGVVRLADLVDPDGNRIRLAGHSEGFGG